MNRCEAEIDAIRLKLHEETKHLSNEEQTERLNKIGSRLAVQYGFKILERMAEIKKEPLPV